MILQNHNQFRRKRRRLLWSNLKNLFLRLWPRNNSLMKDDQCTQLTCHHNQFNNHNKWRSKWGVNSQGSVKSRTNQFTTEKETSYMSMNHNYGGRWWGYGSWCRYTLRWWIDKDGKWPIHEGSKWTGLWKGPKSRTFTCSRFFVPTK